MITQYKNNILLFFKKFLKSFHRYNNFYILKIIIFQWMSQPHIFSNCSLTLVAFYTNGKIVNML